MESLKTLMDAGKAAGDSDSGYCDSCSTFGTESSETLDNSMANLTLEGGKSPQGSTQVMDDKFRDFSNYMIQAFTPDVDGDTYLHILPAQDMFREMQGLIDLCPHSSLLDIQNQNKQAAIHVAAYLGLTTEIEMLIYKNARLDLVDGDGKNIIHLCAERGHLNSLKSIIDICKRTNKMDSLVQLLQTTNNSGYRPFYCAVIHKRKDICQLLVDVFPNLEVNAVDMKNGNSPLHEAVMMGNSADLVGFLLSHCKLNVNSQNNQDVTPLHIAACKGDEAVCAILLESNAQSELKDLNGNIPAVYATTSSIYERLMV